MNLIIYLLPLSGDILLSEYLEHSFLDIEAAVVPFSFRSDCEASIQKLEQNGIPYRIPRDLNDPDFREWIEPFSPDLGVSVGFDKKLPEWLINLPTDGTMNIHPSLLPYYRGANPYFWVIRNGEEQTGVTIHWMDAEFDTGPILSQSTLDLSPDETMGTLFFVLNRWGVEQTITLIEEHLKTGSFRETKQQETGEFPRAPQVEDQHLRIDWQETYQEIDALVRAGNPFLGTFTTFRGAIVRVFEVEKHTAHSRRKPGEVKTTDRGPVVECADAGVLLKVVQMEQFYKCSGEQFQKREKKAFDVLDRMI